MTERCAISGCARTVPGDPGCFYRAGYLEVETPVKIHAPAPEEYIESVQAEKDFLRTSPELAMKVLLADGMEKIFQIGPCFRANESGRRHREEFTMLEYYSRGTGYRELAEFTAGFVAEAAERVLGSTRIEYGGKQIDLSAYEFVTVDDAFRLHAGCTASEADALDRFDELMVTKIEPELGNGKLTFLCDYPGKPRIAGAAAGGRSVGGGALGTVHRRNRAGECVRRADGRKGAAGALPGGAEVPGGSGDAHLSGAGGVFRCARTRFAGEFRQRNGGWTA